VEQSFSCVLGVIIYICIISRQCSAFYARKFSAFAILLHMRSYSCCAFMTCAQCIEKRWLSARSFCDECEKPDSSSLFPFCRSLRINHQSNSIRAASSLSLKLSIFLYFLYILFCSTKDVITHFFGRMLSSFVKSFVVMV